MAGLNNRNDQLNTDRDIGWSGLDLDESMIIDERRPSGNRGPFSDTDKRSGYRSFVNEPIRISQKDVEKEKEAFRLPVTKEDRLISRVIIAGVMFASGVMLFSLLTVVYPSAPSDTARLIGQGILQMGDGISRFTLDTRDWIIAYFREKQEKKARDLAEKTALMNKILKVDESEAESGPDEGKADGETKSSGIYSQNPDTGEMEELELPKTLFYVTNDYDVLLDTPMGPMLYFNQKDSHWKDYLIGGSDPIANYGCGPTTVAMIANSFAEKKKAVTPQEVAEWAYDNKLYAKGEGSYHSLIRKGLESYGLEVESVTDRSEENVRSVLNQGHVIVALMGPGTLTDNGHFIVIARNAAGGDVMIADSADFENCKQTWPLKQLLKELKGPDNDGGPLWAVSVPAVSVEAAAEGSEG